MDGEIELVCGAFSSDPAKSKETGKALYLPENRVYNDFEEMILKEKQLPEGNAWTLLPSLRPTTYMPHLRSLHSKTASTSFAINPLPLIPKKQRNRSPGRKNRPGFLSYTQLHRLPNGKGGPPDDRVGCHWRSRKVIVEYPQGWLATLVEVTGNKQAAWRTDPKRSGAAEASATLVHMPKIWPNTSPDLKSPRFAPTLRYLWRPFAG